MRLWSIHPKYLDSKGLTALWREGLLAKKVLANRTKGYKNHPQLLRFKKLRNPMAAINAYLTEVLKESCARGYSFNASKIRQGKIGHSIPVTRGQADYEIFHLKRKLKKRDYKKYLMLKKIIKPELNCVFKARPGNVESWEKLYTFKYKP